MEKPKRQAKTKGSSFKQLAMVIRNNDTKREKNELFTEKIRKQMVNVGIYQESVPDCPKGDVSSIYSGSNGDAASTKLSIKTQPNIYTRKGESGRVIMFPGNQKHKFIGQEPNIKAHKFTSNNDNTSKSIKLPFSLKSDKVILPKTEISNEPTEIFVMRKKNEKSPFSKILKQIQEESMNNIKLESQRNEFLEKSSAKPKTFEEMVKLFAKPKKTILTVPSEEPKNNSEKIRLIMNKYSSNETKKKMEIEAPRSIKAKDTNLSLDEIVPNTRKQSFLSQKKPRGEGSANLLKLLTDTSVIVSQKKNQKVANKDSFSLLNQSSQIGDQTQKSFIHSTQNKDIEDQLDHGEIPIDQPVIQFTSIKRKIPGSPKRSPKLGPNSSVKTPKKKTEWKSSQIQEKIKNISSQLKLNTPEAVVVQESPNPKPVTTKRYFMDFMMCYQEEKENPYLKHLMATYTAYLHISLYLTNARRSQIKISLPGPPNPTRLLILLDIDETLVHCDVREKTRSFYKRVHVHLNDSLNRKMLVRYCLIGKSEHKATPRTLPGLDFKAF